MDISLQVLSATHQSRFFAPIGTMAIPVEIVPIIASRAENVCLLLDREQQACGGYNSFYWRYFNCGRYPHFE